MKILISEAHSASNIGDLELVVRSIDVVRQRFPGAQLACIGTDPDSFSDFVGQDVELRQSVYNRLDYIAAGKLKRLVALAATSGEMAFLSVAAMFGKTALKSALGGLSVFSRSAKKLRGYLDADLICAVGGGYFGNSYWKHSTITLWTWWIAGRAGVPVETMPISMEITAPWLQRVVRTFGKNVKWRLRDSLSVERLRRCGVRGEHIPDLAFLNFSDERAVPEAGRTGNLMIALVGSDYLTPQGADSLYWQLADNCRAHFPYYKISLLAMHKPMQETSVGGDVKASEICAGYLIKAGMAASVVSANTFEEVLDLCAQQDFVVSARMHAGIAAMCAGARVGLLAYESKHFALMDDLGLAAHVVPIDADSAAISELMSGLKATERKEFVDQVRKHKALVVQGLGLPEFDSTSI